MAGGALRLLQIILLVFGRQLVAGKHERLLIFIQRVHTVIAIAAVAAVLWNATECARHSFTADHVSALRDFAACNVMLFYSRFLARKHGK